MKRLIVNADDFGLSRGVNRAIVECHQLGIVTSATLMANSDAFEDAVELAREHPRLSVGCHVTLMDGEPVLPVQEVSSLLCDGREFYRTITDFAPRALLGRFKAAEVEAEAVAQFQRIQQAGITLSHFDAHKHAHMFPAIAEPLFRAAQKCGIPAVRNPFEKPVPLRYSTVFNSNFRVRWAEVVALRQFQSQFESLAHRYGIHTTTGSIGIVATGVLDRTILREMFARLEDGTWELVCHPGYNDGDLARVITKLRESREVEREALTDRSVFDQIKERGMELISFRELIPGEGATHG
jgi:hopanoid biosynthesis associated protein HpnK